MSNSSLAKVKVPASSSNYTKGRSYKISKITVHHMAGKLTAKQCGRVFQASGRGASAHYGIGSDGKIGLYVDEKNAAWADANRTSNHKSVTIEVANSSTGGQWPVSNTSLKLLIKLCADIAKRNGLGKLVAGKNLTWHSMYASTTCPGPYLRSNMKYIAQEANKLNGYGTSSTTTSTKLTVDGSLGSKTITALQKMLTKAGYKCTADGVMDPKTIKALQKFLKAKGYSPGSIDGIMGAKTIKALQKFLKAEGYSPGTIDGVMGPKTIKALQKYINNKL